MTTSYFDCFRVKKNVLIKYTTGQKIPFNLN